MNNYWHIELYSGEIIKVKPNADNIKFIQEKLAKQEGAITTATRSIVVKDIKDFRLSEEPFIEQKLLEDAAHAFNEPIITERGIKSEWVRKTVPRRRWEAHYAHIPSYKFHSESDNSVTMVFKLPVHLIDRDRVQIVNSQESQDVPGVNTD